jgi:hypothetical protein
MTARLLEARTPLAPVTSPPPADPPRPDPGYDALARLTQLRDSLLAVPRDRRSRWAEPPPFFFDRHRQADLESTRPIKPADPLAEVSARIAAELPALCASVEVRRVARTVDGLKATAETLAPACPAAKELADLLAVPDDEVIVVLHPGLRAGFRFVVRGVADVGQFHVLLAEAIIGDWSARCLPGTRFAERYVSACRDVNPAVPAGVPMVAEARFQMYTPAALRPDGTLPTGFAGCEHWLWPATGLASVPRVNGERVVLLGPPAFRATWDVTRRFPAMAADVRLLDVLSAFRVGECLARLTGHPVPPLTRSVPEPALARAA